MVYNVFDEPQMPEIIDKLYFTFFQIEERATIEKKDIISIIQLEKQETLTSIQDIIQEISENALTSQLSKTKAKSIYQIIKEEHRKRMTLEEMKQSFDGKWVYITNCVFTSGNKIIDGIPVIVGDMAFAGVEDGIYESLKDNKYAPRCDLDLTSTV